MESVRKEDIKMWLKIGTDDKENVVIVQEIIGRTIANLRAATIDYNNTSSNDLKEHIKSHFNSALKEYFEYRDDPRQFDKFKFVLIDELKNAFKDFCLDYTSKCSAYLSEAGSSFRLQADALVNSKCLPLENLNGILGEVKAKVIQQFERLSVADSDQLNRRLDEETQTYISANNNRLAQLYHKYNAILEDLLEKYEEIVEMRLPDDELETVSEQKLESTFNTSKKLVLGELNKRMQFDVPEIKTMFEHRTEALLGERFAQKVQKSKSSKEKKFAEAADVVNSAVDSFKMSLTETFGKQSNNSEVNTHRISKMNELIFAITDDIYGILPDRKNAKEMVEVAKQKMEKVYADLQSQHWVEVQRFHEQWEAELNSICETFNHQFNERCQSAILPDLEELRNERNIIISSVIRKINWLSAHKKTDLLESFKNAAKQQMSKLSEPILERHSKLLGNNFGQQQQVMNGCLEAHQTEMNVLLKGELTDDVHIKAKSLGNAAIDSFENQIQNISPISPSATKTLKEILSREIAKIQNKFDQDLRNRILMANAEVSKLVTDSVDDYKQLINAFSIASNYAQDKIIQIHNNLKTRSHLNLQKNLRLAKYAGDVKEQQVRLESMVDKAYNDAMVAIDNQRAEWNQKLVSCDQKAMNHYKQLFNSNVGSAATEEELKHLHDDFKEQAIAMWEESFPIHYFGDKLLPESRRFSNNLDSEFNTRVCPMWHQINLDVDRSTKNAVEKLVKKYEEQMKSALWMDYSSDDFITSKHEQFDKQARTGLNRVDKPKNVSTKVYDDLLASRLDNTLNCLRTENAQKKEAIHNDLSAKVLQLKENIKGELWDVKVFPETSQLFATYKDRAIHLIHRLKVPNEIKEELASLAKNKLMETLTDLKSEWDNIQPDINQLLLAINTAVSEYNREMENRTSEIGRVYNNKHMNKHHVHSLQIVQKKFEESVKQTCATREQFNKAIEEVQKKFEDLNDLRAAEHSEATVGIDLGTTFSCVAIFKGDKIEMIPDREHHSNTVPSYVFYESATKTVVGHSAKDQSIIHPRTTIFDSKRLIGRKFSDPQVQEDITLWPFKVIRDPDVNRKEPKIEIHGKSFHPEEVSAEILKHLKANAELYLGREVKDVVITVPAYFNDAQKRATKNAAALAGVNALEIISEPTSAAIAYSLNYTDGKNKNIFVFDLGGGTFDVSVLSTGEKCDIKVKAVGGDNHLGGEDFDTNMVDFCIKKFRNTTGLSIPKNVPNDNEEDENEVSAKVFETLRRLRQKCEQAKINLSKTDKVRVVVDYIYQQKNMDVEITVKDFNEMNEKLFDKCIKVVSDTLRDSKLSKADIDDVVLVGGSSRIPEVQRLLSEFFDGKSLIMTLNPDEVVAQGAAYRAAMLSGSKSRELASVKFQDVNPLSLGIEVRGRKFSIIIPKNTPLPAMQTETYVTTKDYQTKMNISVYEGEDEGKIENNNLMGEFTLSDIPSKRKGQEPVDVTIECDEEGLIHVTAKVRSNNRSDEIKIQSNRGGLTEEDITNVLSGKKT